MRVPRVLASLVLLMTPSAHAGQPVSADHGMVATSHARAVEVGVEVLKRGGNALDAAIATNAAMGAVQPMSRRIRRASDAPGWVHNTPKHHPLHASGSS